MYPSGSNLGPAPRRHTPTVRSLCATNPEQCGTVLALAPQPSTSERRPSPGQFFAQKQKPVHLGSLWFPLVLFASFGRRSRWLFPEVCPSTHLMDLNDAKTDRSHFWSVFHFAQPRYCQTLPTTPPENRPKNSPGHCQFSVRHSSVGHALTSLEPTGFVGDDTRSPAAGGLACLPSRLLHTLREVGLVHRVGSLFAKNKNQVPLGALWCLLVPYVGSLTFQFFSRRPSSGSFLKLSEGF